MIYCNLDNFHVSKEDLRNSPSRYDGVSEEVEMELRSFGTTLIQEGGTLLDVPQVVMATGQVLFHRFYCKKSMAKYDVEVRKVTGSQLPKQGILVNIHVLAALKPVFLVAVCGYDSLLARLQIRGGAQASAACHCGVPQTAEKEVEGATQGPGLLLQSASLPTEPVQWSRKALITFSKARLAYHILYTKSGASGSAHIAWDLYVQHAHRSTGC